MELEMKESVCVYVCMYLCVYVCGVGWGCGKWGVLFTCHTPPKQSPYRLRSMNIISPPCHYPPPSPPFPIHSTVPPWYHKTLPHLSVSHLLQLPDTSYICYYHSVLHSIRYESKAGSGPLVFHVLKMNAVARAQSNVNFTLKISILSKPVLKTRDSKCLARITQ